MRIILFISSMSTGGAERVAATLVNAWCDAGHHVILMPTFSGHGDCFYSLHRAARLVYLADQTEAPRTGGLVAYARRAMALRHFVRTHSPDVLVCFLPNVSIMVLIATLGLGLRTIVCERTDPFQMPVSGALKFLRALTYPLASRLIVQTQAVAQQFQRLWRPLPELDVIGNPIPEAFAAAPSWRPARKIEKRLIAVGRLSEEKRFETLIEVFALLAPRHPDWFLRIIGEGPTRPALEAAILKFNLKDRVELPGRTAQVEQELAQAEVFVLTSRYEGFPNALLEAMAIGLPCVSVDCPSGPREITESGRVALLVPMNDSPALVSALDQVMSNVELRLRLSTLGRQSVMERFSLPTVLNKWEQILTAS